jgi:hypothetical protein
VEQSELLRGGYRVFILPHSSALSASEAQAIRTFVAQGGVVIADGEPGAFDEHGRRLPQGQLADLFGQTDGKDTTEHAFERGKAIHLNANLIDYHRERVLGKGGETRDMIAGLLHDAGVKPAFSLTEENGRLASGVELHQFRNGDVTILGLLTNPDLRVDELGPPDFRSNEHFARPRSLKLTIPESMFVYDVRAGSLLGNKRELSIQLDPFEPVVYALWVRQAPDLVVRTPERVARGEIGYLGFSFNGHTSAATHILHVEVNDPAGRVVPFYSGNLRAPSGHAVWAIPVACNDAAGKWSVHVKDLLTGQTRTAGFEIF